MQLFWMWVKNHNFALLKHHNNSKTKKQVVASWAWAGKTQATITWAKTIGLEVTRAGATLAGVTFFMKFLTVNLIFLEIKCSVTSKNWFSCNVKRT